jgi:hypothetical protein
MNSTFTDLLSKLNEQYTQKPHEVASTNLKGKIVITEDDFKDLSKFELQTIRTISNIYVLN